MTRGRCGGGGGSSSCRGEKEEPAGDDLDHKEEAVLPGRAPGIGGGGGGGGSGGRGGGEDEKKRRSPSCSSSWAETRRGGGGSGAGGLSPPCCQAESCTADLTEAKRYHRRHKVCEAHSKAAVVVVAGLRQRFCQQCSRFHELSEFDEAKRSCRRRLAGHNERRRKSSSESQGEGSDRCGQADRGDRAGGAQIALPRNNSTYKHFQIR